MALARVSDDNSDNKNNLGWPMDRKSRMIVLLIVVLTTALAGCSAIVAVGDAAITVGATAVKITAKAVGAVADAVIPDGDKKKEDK